MNRNMRLFLCVASALAVFACVAAPVSAQVVPDTVDPYELAPQNVHLYPFSLNARMPFYYLPPIFAPTPMWRGALDEQIMHTMAPHNYVVMEIPDSTALVAWGTVKKTSASCSKRPTSRNSSSCLRASTKAARCRATTSSALRCATCPNAR